MANNCFGTMCAIGTIPSLKELEARMTRRYNYNSQYVEEHGGQPCDGKHLCRIFDAYHYGDYIQIGPNLFKAFFFIDCAWSIYSCMCDGDHTYYNDLKDLNDVRLVTNLKETSKELGLDIEIHSEEYGMGFQEIIRYINGNCIYSESKPAFEFTYSDYDNYKDFCDSYAFMTGSTVTLTEDEFNKYKKEDNEYHIVGGFENYDDFDNDNLNVMTERSMVKRVKK